MTSKQFLGLIACAAGLAALGNACVVKTTTTGSGGTTSATSATNTTGTKMTTVTGATTSTSTGGGSGHDINSAMMLTVNDPAGATQGTFVDATKTHDFYTFNGTAGERIVIVVQATGATMGANPAATDPAFSLIGSGKDPSKPLTYQTGGWPNFQQAAQLFVQLPATGAYYLDLSDCNAFFSMGCPNPAAGVSDLGYAVFVGDTSKLTAPENLATAANGTQANALPVAYKATTTAGQYYDAIMGGAFTASSQTQVFSFKPPADTMITAGAQARAEFYVQPIGGNQGGNLSDTNIKVWITDSTGKQIAADDQNNYPTNSTTYTPLEFSVPYVVGSTYYLYVQNTAAQTASSFFFIDHYLNPLIDVAEKSTGLNTHNAKASAEALTAQGTAKDFFTVDGTIAAVTPNADVDWYSMTVPTGKTQFQLSCDSARSGSGLGGFNATLYQTDGTTSFATATESATMDLFTPAANIPAAVTAGSTIYLKATASTQDATNNGSMYRCYVFFQ